MLLVFGSMVFCLAGVFLRKSNQVGLVNLCPALVRSTRDLEWHKGSGVLASSLHQGESVFQKPWLSHEPIKLYFCLSTCNIALRAGSCKTVRLIQLSIMQTFVCIPVPWPKSALQWLYLGARRRVWLVLFLVHSFLEYCSYSRILLNL